MKNTQANTTFKSFGDKIWLAYKAFAIAAIVSLIIYLLGLTAAIGTIAIVFGLALTASLLGLLVVSVIGAIKAKHGKQIIFIATTVIVLIIIIAGIANFIDASASLHTIESIQYTR